MNQPFHALTESEALELVDFVPLLRDGGLTSIELSRLDELVCQRANGAQTYLRAASLVAGLQWRLSSQKLLGEATEWCDPSAQIQVPQVAHQLEPRFSLSPAVPPAWRNSVPFSTSRLFSLAVCVALVAVCVYGSFALIAWNLRPDKWSGFGGEMSTSVAVVRDTADVQWSKNALSKPADSPILSGEPLQIESGTVEFELKTGATLVVEGPADWSVDGQNSVSLRAGKLTARVPKDAIGFIVETPTAKIVDLGTEFGVEVASGETSVHVFKGAVELSQHGSHSKVGDRTSPSTLRLEAGKAMRTTAEGIVATELVPGKFVRPVAKASPKLRVTGQTWMIDLKTAAATQSSSQNPVIHPAQCAIDGDRQTASHTAAKDSAAWLQIDLKTARSITAIVLFSRPDRAGWLRDITVKLLAEDGKTVVATSPKLNPKNTWGGGEEDFIEGPNHVAFDLLRTGGGPSSGRYVRIEREPSTLDSARIKTQGTDSGEYWALACKNSLLVAEAQVFGSAPSAAATTTRGAETDGNTSASAVATITWGAATDVNSSTLTDFSTAGTLFDAVTIYPTADLVIGTTPSTTFHRREISSNNPLGFVGSRIAAVVTSGVIGVGSQVFDSVPTNDYQRMLSHGTFGHGARKLVISGLTPGRQYQVQVWTPYWDQPAAETTFTAGNSVTLKVGFVEEPNGPISRQPQFAIGTFTANATRQVIHWTSRGNAMFGAIQVRDLTPLSEPSATDDKSATKP